MDPCLLAHMQPTSICNLEIWGLPPSSYKAHTPLTYRQLKWCCMVHVFSCPGGAMVLFGDEGKQTGTGHREVWQWPGWTQHDQPEMPPQK